MVNINIKIEENITIYEKDIILLNNIFQETNLSNVEGKIITEKNSDIMSGVSITDAFEILISSASIPIIYLEIKKIIIKFFEIRDKNLLTKIESKKVRNEKERINLKIIIDDKTIEITADSSNIEEVFEKIKKFTEENN